MATTIERVCRICFRGDVLLRILSESIPPRYGSKSLHVQQLSELFQKILVVDSSYFSDTICSDCLDKVQQTYIFLHECEKATAVINNIGKYKVCCERLTDQESQADSDFEKEFGRQSPENLKDLSPALPSLITTDDSSLTQISSSSQLAEVDYGTKDENFEQIADDLSDVSKAQYECNVCNKIYKFQYHLKRHMRIHDPEGRPYECEICKRRFATAERKTRHLLIHNTKISESSTILDTNLLQCPDCELRFEKQESLASHMRIHRRRKVPSDKVYTCQICLKTFSKYTLLTQHEKSHDELKKYRCNVCDKKFATNSLRVSHLSRHVGSGDGSEAVKFDCKVCGKGFHNQIKLSAHQRIHTSIPGTSYICTECDKTFSNAGNLNQHLQRHSDEKSICCPHCPSRFVCKSDLKSHLSTHEDNKRHSCDQCNMKFTKMYLLKKHRRIHTGEKPYECNNCTTRFSSLFSLKRHQLTHSGQKPYSCQYCKKAFSQSNDLVKHMRTHFGEKVYKCDDCSKSFRLFTELRKHRLTHFEHENIESSENSNSLTSSSTSGQRPTIC